MFSWAAWEGTNFVFFADVGSVDPMGGAVSGANGVLIGGDFFKGVAEVLLEGNGFVLNPVVSMSFGDLAVFDGFERDEVGAPLGDVGVVVSVGSAVAVEVHGVVLFV